MSSSAPLRLAIWSGPRNVSTALMRSFGSRDDTAVCDEPLYAHYLAVTGLDHPIAQQVIAQHEADWRKVARWLSGPVPGGKAVFYQKHMAHHLLPEVGRDWMDALTPVFLIRRPRFMLASLSRILPRPTLRDTGLPQQLELFQSVRQRTGQLPPVMDAADLLQAPPAMLARLCSAVGLDFQPAMLSWEPGLRDTDGCWAPHWYGRVAQTTGFAPYSPSEARLPDALSELCARCDELYAQLYEHRLRAD